MGHLSLAVEFPKTLDANIQFPPIVQRREGMPTGHLRPLGWQSRAQGSVKEEAFILKPEQFWDKYLTTRQPVMIRSLVAASESVDKWTDTYLSRQYGHLDIQVTKLKENLWQTKTSLSLEAFLRRYRSDDLYLRVILPEVMQPEAPMPNLINCGPFTANASMGSLVQLVEPYLWISAGDTSSLLHAHPEHNLHCMIDGRMDFILIPQEQFKDMDIVDWQKKLALHTTFEHSGELFSKIDVDMVNAYRYDILQKINWYWSTVKAGDCIYIPAGYLHQMRSHGRSVSTSTYFASLKNGQAAQKSEMFAQCPPNAPSFEAMHLFREHFLWTYTHGERHLNARAVGESEARGYLNYLMRDDAEVLFYERFEAFFGEVSKEGGGDLSAGEVWQDFFLPEVRNERNLSSVEIGGLKLVPNLERFVSVLNKAISFHVGNVERDEL